MGPNEDVVPAIFWGIGSGRATTRPIPVRQGSVEGTVVQLLDGWAWEARVSTGGWSCRHAWYQSGVESSLMQALARCEVEVMKLWDTYRLAWEVEEGSRGDAGAEV